MFKKIFKNELLRGSLILLLLTAFGNFLSYVFQFTMAWMLGPSDYSILAAITSLIAIFGIPTLSLQTIIAKHTTELKVKKEIGKIKGMFKFLTKRVLAFSTATFIIFSLISYIWLSEFLKIPFSLLVLTGIFIFGAFLYPVAAGILQGTKKFQDLGVSFVINCLTKLIVGVLLVVIGWKVYGAVLGFVSGIIVSFLIIFPFLKDIFEVKESKEKFSIFSKKSLLPFIAIVILVLIYSLDVIFAKAYFSAEIAGKYAVISLLGKIILFLTVSVGNVMLPISTERFIDGQKTKVLEKTILLVFLICGFALIFFLFFPDLIVQLLFGSQYSSASGILLYIGIAFSSISFLNIFILNSISKNQFRKFQFIYLLSGLILQIILLSIFNQTIEQFSLAFMFSTIITLFGGFVFLKPLREYF